MARAANNNAEGAWVGCNVDFGDEQSLELDYRRPEGPWLSVGSGIAAADVWFRGLAGLPDIRFRIERIRGGLQVYLDRGDQSELWWPKEAPPRLMVVFDPGTGTVTASAAVGLGQEFQEVTLGTTAF